MRFSFGSTAPMLALPLLLSSACDSVGSSEIRTSQIGLQASAIGFASGEVEFHATLTTDNPALLEVTYIDLEPGDGLYGSIGEAEIRLREEFVPVLGIYQYRGSIVNTTGTGGQINVEFDRIGDIDAPFSSAPLPTPFEIIGPPQAHSRGQDLELSWSVSDEVETTRVLARGDCIDGSEVRIDSDPGFATIRAAAFAVPAADTTGGAGCTVSVQVDRIADGDVDPAYGRGGRIEAGQTRSFTLELN